MSPCSRNSGCCRFPANDELIRWAPPFELTTALLKAGGPDRGSPRFRQAREHGTPFARLARRPDPRRRGTLRRDRRPFGRPGCLAHGDGRHRDEQGGRTGTHAAYNAGNWDANAEYVAVDVVDRDAPASRLAGLEGITQQRTGFNAAFTGDVVIYELVAEGDLVTDLVHLDGTQTGDFFGMPATGKPVHIEAIEEWRIAGGKIVERWHVENLLQVLVQLSAIPAPGGEAAPSPEA